MRRRTSADHLDADDQIKPDRRHAGQGRGARRVRPNRAWLLGCEGLEDRTLLTAITANQKSAIISGLQALDAFGTNFTGFGPLSAPLPIVGKSLGQVLDTNQALTRGLDQLAENYFATHPAPTLEELLSALNTTTDTVVGGVDIQTTSTVTATTDATGNTLKFGVAFGATGTSHPTIDLGAQATALGLTASAAADVNASLNLNFGFTADNAQNFALRFNNSSPAKLSAGVNAGGTLALSVPDPSHGNAATAVTATVNQFSFNPSVTATFLDPNHNGQLTAADLQGDVSRVVGLTTAGALSAQLTVSGGLPGLGALGTATIGVNDTNVFSGAAPDVSVGVALNSNAIRQGILDIVTQLDVLGDQVRGLPALDVTLPVINQSVNQLFSQAPGLKIGDFLKLKDVVTTYFSNNGSNSTAQGLIQALEARALQLVGNAATGSLAQGPLSLTGGLDPKTDQILFDARLNSHLGKSLPIGLGAKADAIGLSASGSLNVDVNMNLDAAFGLNLAHFLATGSFDPSDVFVRVNNLNAAGAVHATGVNFGVSFANPAASLGVVNGTLDFTSAAALAIQKPSGADPKTITLADLQSTSIAGLVALSTSGALSAKLPLSATLPGLGALGTATVIVTDSNLFAGAVPDVSLSVALSSDMQTKILAALDQLQTAGDRVLNFQVGGVKVLDLPLPGLGKSINQLFQNAASSVNGVGDILKLKDAAVAYFNGATSSSPPTIDGLVQALSNRVLAVVGNSASGSLSRGPLSISGGLDPTTKQIVFDIAVDSHLAEVLPLDLGSKAQSLGVTASGNLNVDADLNLDTLVGIDLNHLLAGSPITPADVYLQVNTLSASGAVHATDLNLGLAVGGFGVQVAHGTLDFTPTASLAVKKPDGTKKLTLADLQSTSIGDLVSLSTSGALSASLPITGVVPGFEALGTVTVAVNDSNLFAGAAPDVSLSIALSSDMQAKILAALDQLQTAGDRVLNFQVGGVKVLDLPLPGLGKSVNQFFANQANSVTGVGDILRLKDTAAAYFNAAANSGSPTLDGLVQVLSNRVLAVVGQSAHGSLSRGPLSISGGLDPATRQIVFDVAVDSHLAKTLPLDLGTNAQNLGLTATGNLSVDATIGLDVQLGIDLTHFLAAPPQITPDDVFIEVNQLTAGGSVNTTGLNFGVSLTNPMASLSVNNGSVQFSPQVAVAVQKPDGTKKLTLTDLQSSSIADLVSLNTSGQLSATLPLSGTLPQPLGNLGTATVVVTDTNVFAGAAPDVSVSFALSQELQSKIFDALAKLDQAGDAILGLSILDTKLPVIDKSINELFHHTTGANTSSPNVGDFLKLKDAVAAYFAGGSPTVAGLIQTLETKALDLVGASAHGSLSEGPFSIAGGLDPASKQLVFDVRLNPHFSKDLALNLGDKATALGLSLSGTTNLSVDVGLDLDAEFGIDLNHFLSDPTSITAGDVFLQVNTLTASGSIHAADVNFSATFGGAGIQVAHGTVDFTPSATLTVQKPDGTKRLTLQDLQSISLGGLVSLSTSGTLSATLPIIGTLPGNLGNLGTATVVVQDTNVFAGVAPDVSVSFALSQQLQTKILDALAKLEDAGSKILGLSILDTKLPVINQSINELFHHATASGTNGPSIGDFLKLKDAVAAYFANGTPSVEGLVQALEAKALELIGSNAHGSLSEGAFSISGGLDPNTKLLSFDIRLNPQFSKDLAINLGDKASAIGLTLAGTTNISVNVGLDLDVKLGIDLNHFLADPSSITASDVFLQVNSLTATGSVVTNNLNFGVTLGGASLQVVNGQISFTPTATLTVQKPDGSKKITLQDLQTTNIGDLVNFTPTGALSAHLPITGTLPPPFGNLGTATVVVNEANVFSGAAPDVSVSFALSQGLQDQIVNVLSKLDDAGNKLLGLSILDTQLPGIGKSINDLFHDATANGPKVGDFLKLKDAVLAYFAQGTPDVQGLIDALRTKALALLGGAHGSLTSGPFSISGGLDTTTNQLVFDVTFNSHFAHDFALSLGSNAANLGLTLGGNTTVSVDASVDMDVQFGIDLNHFLSNPASITPSDVFLQVNRLSASGSVDTNNLNFSIGFGGASLSVVNGSLHFTPKGTLAVQKPDGTKRITLQDLLSTNLGDFVTLNATGALSATLPISGALPGLGNLGTATVVLNSANLFSGAAPDVSITFALSQGMRDKINGILQKIDDFGESVLHFPLLDTKLPVINKSINELFHSGSGGTSVGDFFKFKDAVTAYFSGVTGGGSPTAEGLVQALISKALELVGSQASGSLSNGPISITGGLDPATKVVDFHVVFDFNRDLGNVPLNLGAAAESLGLGLDASANVDLGAHLNLDFDFGIDLNNFLSNPSAGISDDDVFLNVNNASATGHVHADGLNLSATLGFLQAGVVDGTADLSATAVVTVSHNGNNRITLHDIETTPIGDLIHLSTPTSTPDNTAANALHVVLPIHASIGSGFSTPTGPDAPTVTLATTDLFHTPPALGLKNFGQLVDFTNIGPAQVLSLIGKLGTFLGQFHDSAFLSTKIPFTQNKTLGDLLDLGTSFANQLADRLKASPDKNSGPSFSSAQDLAQQLGTLLGLPQFSDPAQHVLGIDLAYDPDAHELTFHVRLSPQYAASLPFDLGLNMNGLAGASATGSLSVNAQATIQFTIGLSLAASAVPSLVGSPASPLPANGRIDEDAHFTITVGTGAPVDVVLNASDTQLNTSIVNPNDAMDTATLVGDLNAALAATSLAGKVVAAFENNHLVFKTASLTAGTFLKIQIDDPTDAAATVFGFVDGQSAHATSGGLFIQDGSIGGSLSLNTSGGTHASARLGFLSVSSDSINVGANGVLTIDLTNPDPAAPNPHRIYLSQLLANLSDLAKVAHPTLTGAAHVYLDNIDVNAGFSLPVHPSIHIDVADLTHPTQATVDVVGAGSLDLKNLQNLSLEDIIHGIQQAVDSLSEDDSFVLLNKKLPVINKSIRELVDFAGDLSAREQELRRHPIQATADGKLDGDTTVVFTIGANPPTTLTLLKSVTDDNTSIDDLVDDINEALGNTAVGNVTPSGQQQNLNALVKALNVGGQVVFATTADTDEYQQIMLTADDGQTLSGSFTLTFDGATTGAIPVGASAAAVQMILEALGVIGAGNVNVTGNAGGPYLVEFTGALAKTDVNELGVGSQPTNGSAAVTTLVEGNATSINVDISGGNTASNVLQALLDSILPANNAVTLSYDTSDSAQPAFRLKINYHTSFQARPSVNLDIATLANLVGDPSVKAALLSVSQFVDVSGSTPIDVSGGADLTLDLGLAIDPNTHAISPFVYGDTGATLTAKFEATNLNFNAAVGPLGLFIRGGTASLDDGNTSNPGPVTFGVTIRDATASDRIAFDDLLGLINIGLNGKAHVDLPLFFPTETTPLGVGGNNHLVINIGDLGDVLGAQSGATLPSTDLTIATPDINAQFSFLDVLDLLKNPAVITDGIDHALASLQNKLNSLALGLPFPIVGNHLKDGAQFIAAIRTYVIQKLGEELAKISNVNELQVITLTDDAGATRSGTFRLTFQGQTTGDIPANATADDIKDALEQLSNINPGDVDVEPAGNGGFTVKFQNGLGYENVEQMTVAQQPTDGTVSISTQTEGAASIINLIQEGLYEVFTTPNFNVLDAGFDGDPTLSRNDVAFVANGTHAEFDFHLHQNVINQAVPFGFDMGIPGLGLQVNAALNLMLGWDLYFGFGVDTTSGFYINTVAKDSSGNVLFDSNGMPSHQASVTFDASIVENTSNTLATGQLAFLHLDVLKPASGKAADFAGTFLVDLHAPNNEVQTLTLADAAGQTRSGSFRLEFGGQTTTPLDAHANAQDIENALKALSSIGPNNVQVVDGATPGTFKIEFIGQLARTQVALITVAQQPTDGTASVAITTAADKITFSQIISGDGLSTLVSPHLSARTDVNLQLNASFGNNANFPSFATDFHLDWTFAPGDPNLRGSKPHVVFGDVRMSLGEFLSHFAGPILQQVKSAIEPVKPIIDLLTNPIPVISDLAGTNISLLDLAELLDPDIEAQPFIDAYHLLYTLVSSMPTHPNQNLILHFGNFDLGNVDLRTTSLANVDPTQSNVLTPPSNDIQDQLDQMGPEGAFASQLNTSASSSFKFQMPIISKDAPQMIFGIFSGKPADLFTFDMTTLNFMFNYTQEFPVFGPIDATLTGEFDANFHFVFGFDTLGIQEYFADPDKTHFQDIFDGFYLAAAPALPVVALHGGIAAGLGVDLGLIKGGVEGGVFADVNVGLHDPDADGKLRYKEFVEIVQDNPLCLFDVSGTVSARLYAWYQLLVGPRQTKDIVKPITLVSFDVHCDDGDTPVLAKDLGSGVLQLNMGPHAGDRKNGDTSDGNESFSVRHVSGSVGDETVVVSAFGITQQFSHVKKIVADGGAGDDTIDAEGVLADVNFTGGAGNDNLTASDGTATLDGGAGDDTLTAGHGASTLLGGAGNDVLYAGPGNSILTGGAGQNTIHDKYGGSGVVTESADADFTFSDSVLTFGPDGDTLDDVEKLNLTDTGNHHTFTNSAWSGTASLHGGGADLLVSMADENTTLTDTSLGYVNGGLFTLAGISDAHLTGGAGDNTFDVKGWTHNATIDGAAGTDTILSANNASYTLFNTQLSESSGAIFALANVEKADLTGAASDTTFDVSGWTGGGSLTGQTGKNNTVIASNDADFTLTNALLSRSSGGTLALSNINRATLAGGAGANTFTLNQWKGNATLDGAGGDDTYIINLGGPGTAVVNDTGTSTRDQVQINGSAGSHSFAMSATQTAYDTNDVVKYDDNIETVSVNGSADGNSFRVTGTILGTTNIQGGPGVDMVAIQATRGTTNVHTGGGANVVTIGSMAPASGGVVDNFAGAVSVVGVGSDGLTIDDSGSSSAKTGTLDASSLTGLGMGAGGVSFTGVASLNVKLGSGGDTLNVVNTIPGTTSIDTGAGADTVNLQADRGATTIATGDGNDTVNVASTGAVTTINSGAGNDTINVQSVAAATTINAGADDDTINVGSLAPRAGGTLRGIEAAINVVGSSGNDALNVDDSGETIGQNGLQTGWLRANAINGLSMGPAGIAYSTFENLKIALGSGNDNFVFLDNSAPTTVTGGAGADTFRIGPQIDEDGHLIDEVFNGVALNDASAPGVSFVTTIHGDAGDDHFQVNRNKAVLNLFGDADNDTFEITASLADDQTSNTNTGTGANLVVYNVNAQVNIDGGSGFDTVIVSGTSADDTFTITDHGITGPGLAINYTNVESVRINAKKGNDTFNIQSTDVNTLYTLEGGSGDDTFNFGSRQPGQGGVLDGIQGKVVLIGDSGNDTINVDDTGSSASKTGTLSSSGLTGLAMGPDGVVFLGALETASSLEAVHIALGSGNDKLTVQSTVSGPTTVDAGAGADEINVRSIQGPTTISGNTGDDTINVGSKAHDDLGVADLIGAVLTVHGGGQANDALNVDDSGDAQDNVGRLTASKITGLGMPAEVDYDGFAHLKVSLGSGNDTFNVQGTSAASIVDAGGGNDIINVSSDAPANAGNLDAIQQPLTIQAGGGTNTLNVSDVGATAADTNVVIRNNQIAGLAPAAINYDATSAHSSVAGQFGGGINIRGGSGGNTISVLSTFKSSDPRTITTVFAGAGADHVSASLSAATDGFTVLDGQVGNDTIDASSSSLQLTIFGGPGSDTVTGGSGDDTIFGDSGRIYFGTPGGGPVTVLGGAGDDAVAAALNPDADPDSPDLIATVVDPAADGNDVIQAGAGNDIVLGGLGNDAISGGLGSDVLIGDGGRVTLANNLVTKVKTTEPSLGGNDTIGGNENDDVILGGAGDDVLSGDDGNDVVLGDNGVLSYTLDADPRTLDQVTTTSPDVGGADVIHGSSGNDIILAGLGNDTVTGDDGDDIVIGDNGSMAFTQGVVTGIDTTAATVGGADSIWGGNGNDILLGGGGADTISGDADADLILGDSGTVTRDNLGVLMAASTVSSSDDGADVIHGGSGNDVILAGLGNDMVTGDDGDDVIVGDDGQVSCSAGGVPTAIQSTDPTPGGSDTVYGNAGNDIILGGNRGDFLYGGNGSLNAPLPAGASDADIILGDNGQVVLTSGIVSSVTNTGADIGSALASAGGDDVIEGNEDDDILIGGVGNDRIDGSQGRDLILGDVGKLTGRATNVMTNPRFRTLTGTQLYALNNTTGLFDPQVDPNGQSIPNSGDPRWAYFVTTLDDGSIGLFGNDNLAGGPGNDVIFGQGGNDTIQGDGSTLLASMPTASFEDFDHFDAGGNPVPLAGNDGQDYIEGGSGSDTIFGCLGQDDIIGGSSDLFGLPSPSQRTDGSDLIFGGAGTRIGRNDPGDLSSNGHAHDADVILGDNGDIFRPVSLGGNPVVPSYLTFNYDAAAGGYGGTERIIPRAVKLLDYTPGTGAAADNGAADVIHGEAGNDVIYGMTGNDMIYGDGQDDSIYGNAGNDWISGGTGDDGILGDDGLLIISRNGLTEPLYGITTATTQQDINTPGHIQTATINVAGQLKVTADLEPLGKGGNDIIYGGLGNDFLHGGAGDDAISGAEAPAGTSAATAGYVYTAVGVQGIETDFTHPVNPGNSLGYDPVTRKLAAYDAYNPMTKIPNFFLNFDAYTDPSNPAGTKINDGNDVLFGDTGNDWLVGGTNNDDLFGGYGDDLLNVDDNLDTNGGANNQPDAGPSNDSDRAYGGAGLDVMIANTGGDRLIDWVGEFNTYLVPFSPFGARTISRTLEPQLPQFLYALSQSDGADPTRTTAFGTAGGSAGVGYGDQARNGEPYGELGLILQQDPDFQAQTGAPRDPQPGNVPGTKRDVMFATNFNSSGTAGLVPDSGTWDLIGGGYQPTSTTGDATSLIYFDQWMPPFVEMTTTVSILKSGTKQNAFFLFGYQDQGNFLYAGIDARAGTLRIGQRSAAGWVDAATLSAPIRTNTSYSVDVTLNGSTVTLTVGNNGQRSTLQYTFLSAFGVSMLGVGTDSSVSSYNNIQMLKLPIAFTYTYQQNFADGVAHNFTPQVGTWTVVNSLYTGVPDSSGAAITTRPLAVTPSSYLEYSATVNTRSTAGLIFDYYNPTNFKFAAIVAGSNQ